MCRHGHPIFSPAQHACLAPELPLVRASLTPAVANLRCLPPCAAIRDGAHHVVVQQGRVKDPPAQLSAVWRLEAAGVPGWAAPAVSGQPEEEPAVLAAPQDAAAQAEDRAARLAMRRFARDMAVGVQQPQRQRQQQAGRRPVGRPRSSTGGPTTQRRVERPVERSTQQRVLPAATPAVQHSVEIRGPPPPAGKPAGWPVQFGLPLMPLLGRISMGDLCPQGHSPYVGAHSAPAPASALRFCCSACSSALIYCCSMSLLSR